MLLFLITSFKKKFYVYHHNPLNINLHESDFQKWLSNYALLLCDDDSVIFIKVLRLQLGLHHCRPTGHMQR